MTDPASARVFISYSRKDGAAFAASLGKKLLRQSLSVWRDIVALEGGRDWSSQIEDAIRSKALQHFVLVVTQGALESPVVRREIRLARQEGKTVSQRELLARVHEHRVGDAGITLGDQELRKGDGDADLQPVGAIERRARASSARARATPTPASPIAISSGRGPLTTRS